MLSRFLTIFILLSLLCFKTSIAKQKPEYIIKYKEAKNVFIGKVIAIQELKNSYETDNDYFNKKFAIEFEIEKIYKGRRYQKFMLVEIIAVENIDYFSVSNSYLIYATKRKSKNDIHYSSIRTRKKLLEETIDEISNIEGYVKKKFFRRAKNPIPRFKFVSGACNC